jgi:hypothetical protein
MKMLVAAVALATLVASPAFAQSYDPDLGSGNIAAPSDDPEVPSTVFSGNPGGAYAQAYPGNYGAYAQVFPLFGYDAYAQAPTFFGYGGYAPAAPFAYYTGNYGSYAGYGNAGSGDYAQVPLQSGHRAHARVRRHRD